MRDGWRHTEGGDDIKQIIQGQQVQSPMRLGRCHLYFILKYAVNLSVLLLTLFCN